MTQTVKVHIYPKIFVTEFLESPLYISWFSNKIILQNICNTLVSFKGCFLHICPFFYKPFSSISCNKTSSFSCIPTPPSIKFTYPIMLSVLLCFCVAEYSIRRHFSLLRYWFSFLMYQKITVKQFSFMCFIQAF